jgi:uncharacterized membrane protein
MNINPFVLLLIILPPVLYSVTIIIDKNLIKDYSPGPLMAIGGTFNLIVSILLGISIWILDISVSWQNLFFVLINGLLYTVGMFVYLKVLQKEDATRATPFFQLIPAFGLIAGYMILEEKISGFQLLAILFLMFGGLVLAVKDGIVKKKMALLMIVAACVFALRDAIFAKFARDMTVTSALWADQMGKAVFCLMFLLNKNNWSQYFWGLKKKFALQSTNELLYIVADLIFDTALILARLL